MYGMFINSCYMHGHMIAIVGGNNIYIDLICYIVFPCKINVLDKSGFLMLN